MNPRDAFHQTVHAVPGGPEALAPRMDMSVTILRNKANPNCATNKPTLEETDRLMGITGDHRILHALAGNHGYVCVRVEDGASSSDLAVLEIMTKVWSANGDFGAEVNRALEDGRIDRREIARIRETVLVADRAMHQLVARLEGMSEK